ncbi:hypothetical protein OHS59_44285 [Streptomyces sp. NBC_00414]|uniref:hypothetical protein n=1 Tax=Streptomyces sp. NBC_00414 TaxID=2975739 RepID=UPI002E25060E
MTAPTTAARNICSVRSDQTAARPGVRSIDFGYMRDLLRRRPAERREVRLGTSRAEAVMVPLFTTATADAPPATHPEADCDPLRNLGKRRQHPPAALMKAKQQKKETAPA